LRPWFAVAVLPLLMSCAVDRGGSNPPRLQQAAAAAELAPSNRTFALGYDVNASGAVPADSIGDAFLRGNEVFLSVDMSGASNSQRVGVEWRDPAGTIVRKDSRQVAAGAKYVNFSSGRTGSWSRGRHSAVVIIDGRAVTEMPFVVM
jgi:hypothetical protein